MKGDKKKAILDSSDNIRNEITRLQEIFHIPEDFEGYDHVTQKLNGLIWDGLSYIEASNGTLLGNGKRAVEIAEKEMKKALDEINDFIKTDWEIYTKQLNAYYPTWYEKQTPITWR
jgi:hypothetical protein